MKGQLYSLSAGTGMVLDQPIATRLFIYLKTNAMKKMLLRVFCGLLAIIMFSVPTLAYNSVSNSLPDAEAAVLADFDEAEIYSAFDEVNDLMLALGDNSELSYADLEKSNSGLIANVSSSAAIAMNAGSAEPPIVGAFLWGCLFNVVGMLIVGLTTDFDSGQITKSAWGCLVSSLLFGGGLIAF